MKPHPDQTWTETERWIEDDQRGGCGDHELNPSASESGPSIIGDHCYLNGDLGMAPCLYGPLVETNDYATPSEVLITHSTADSATGYAGGSEGVYQEGGDFEDAMIYYRAASASLSVTGDSVSDVLSDLGGQGDEPLWPWEEHDMHTPLTLSSTLLIDEQRSASYGYGEDRPGSEEVPMVFSHPCSGWTIRSN